MASETLGSTRKGDLKPGLFHLSLNVNSLTPERAIKGRIASIQCNVLDEDYGPLRRAANNLLGLLHFYAEDRVQAEKRFETVLETDPHNLNALANLSHLFKARNMTTEAMHFDRRLEKALAGTPEEQSLRKARCRAEQAYCMGFECHKARTDMERYERSSAAFSEAIKAVTDAGLYNEANRSGQCTIAAEVREWQFCQVWVWKQIYNKTYNHAEEKRPCIFHELLSRLCELRKDLRGKGGLMEAQVYTYIAYFFWKKPQEPYPMLPETRKLIADQELECYLTDPEIGHKKAMEICSTSSDVINQYAGYIMHTRKDSFRKAVDDLTSVIEKHKSWFALSKRGETLKKWYKQKCKDENCPRPDLLERAIMDFKEVSDMNPSSFVFTHLGKAFILLGTDRSGDKMVNKRHIVEALDYLQKAEDYGDADHGKLYRLLARCYHLMGKEDEELRALKRSVVTTKESNRSLDNAKRLLYLLLLRYKKKKNEIPPGAKAEVYTEAKSAFIDVFYWMVTFCFKHFREVNVMNKHVQELIGGNEDVFADIRAVLLPLRNESEKLERLDGILDEAKVNVEPQEPLWDLQGHGLCALPPPDTPRCKDFEYDFFVLHAEGGEEERWVSRLFPALEDIHKEGRLKGFHMKRDSKPNETEIRNLEIAIQKSRKIIMVLSPTLIESPFLVHGQDASLYHVLEKRQAGLDKVIVPVIFENCEVPESLAYLRALDISNAIDDSDVLHIRKAVES